MPQSNHRLTSTEIEALSAIIGSALPRLIAHDFDRDGFTTVDLARIMAHAGLLSVSHSLPEAIPAETQFEAYQKFARALRIEAQILSESITEVHSDRTARAKTETARILTLLQGGQP